MPRAAFPLALIAALAASPVLAAPGALYERVFMLEADRRCVLFTPPVRDALQVAAAQARGAAKRAGQAVDTIENGARERARSTSCASADLRLAAMRVRDAHQGWTKVQRLSFPGQSAAWRADRTRFATLRWRLVQSRPGGDFGLATDSSGLLRPYAVARFRKKDRPALVRLTVGRRVFLAEAGTPAPEGLKPADTKRFRSDPAWAFRFPAAAGAALDAAGPHDPVRVDFVAPGRAQAPVRSIALERGDYAAARAFIRL